MVKDGSDREINFPLGNSCEFYKGYYNSSMW